MLNIEIPFSTTYCLTCGHVMSEYRILPLKLPTQFTQLYPRVTYIALLRSTLVYKLFYFYIFQLCICNL